MRYKKLLLSAFLVLVTSFCSAQVTITALNTALTQDFNTLIANGSSTWLDNSTITGWYHARTGNGNTIVAGDGSSNTGALYSFGTGSSTERALGSIGSGNAAVGNIYYGVRLVNNTGTTITSLSITYYGEQWRNSAAAAQTVSFSYQTGTGLTSLLTGTWTAMTALDFTSPVTGGTAGALDGNASANRALISNVISGLMIANGDEVMLRWYDPDHSGSDHGLAIDDFSLTAFGTSVPTSVQFVSASSSINEGGGSISIQVGITNPSPLNATTVQVALTGGTATNGIDIVPAYTTQTLTFPAASAANQSITINIFDDNIYEGNETGIFTLQNAAGGNQVSIGAPLSHTCTIIDNDLPPDPSVVVNEYYNSSGALSTNEAIELIVFKDNLDMRGFSIADGTSGGTYPNGVITFSNDPIWSNVQAGTIILIGGTISIPTIDTDASDGLLKLRVPSAGNSNQYFSANSNSFVISGTSDVVAIRDASGNFIHGLAHGTAHSNTLPYGRHGWYDGTVSNAQSVLFTRSGAPMVVQDFNLNTFTATGNATLGDPNDADGNRSFLRSTRSRIITTAKNLHGTFYWDVIINEETATASGLVNVCNTLIVNDGTFNENGFGLSVNGSGNAQNGTGLGNITVGDNLNAPAMLQTSTTIGTISGTINFNNTDATIEYRGSTSQNILLTSYNNLVLTNGNQLNQKTISGAIAVNDVLTINSGAWLNVAVPNVITLGSTGAFSNAGRFLGSIQTTRNLSTLGVTDNFGGIGMSLTPNAANVPGVTTVKMTSGYYLWMNNLPSILKYYSVNAATGTGNNASLVYKYDDVDLNGQIESNLALKFSPDAGTTWTSLGGALNTTLNTLTQNVSSLNGIWTAHANPPQGTIAADKNSLYFETEQDGPIPTSQSLTIGNLNDSGSIIEWTATSYTVQVPTWLSITPSPANGINTGTFIVNITRSNLVPNTYTGTITITDPHATNNPKIVNITYYVQKKREICVGIDTIFFKASYKKPDPKKVVKVMNCGGNFGPGVIAWSVTTSLSWLTASPLSGLENQSFTLTATNNQQRSIGTYNGSATISGQNSVTGTPIYNSPLIVPVVLEVEPVTNQIISTSNLSAGQTYTIYNSYGQRIAMIKVNSGSISSLTIKMFPFQLPIGTTRLKYVYRYYQFDTQATNYNLDITLFYTSNELSQMNITNPADLKGWRQNPNGGGWQSMPSSSNPIANNVTITGVTSLSGNWTMAVPWTPKESSPIADKNAEKNVEQNSTIPTDMYINQNAPNPFSPHRGEAAQIQFGLPIDDHVTITVVDILGNTVATLVDEQKSAGNHSIIFNGIAMRSGMYFYNIRTASDGKSITKRMMIVK